MINSIRIIIPIICFSLTAFIPTQLVAQFGIQYNSEEALQSYTLLQTYTDTWLIDNCGELLYGWDHGGIDVENHSKLLPNGNVVYITDNQIREADFNGTIVKNTRVEDDNLKLDYEVLVLPNGNYLCVARRIETTYDGDLGTLTECFFGSGTPDYSFFLDRGYNTNTSNPAWADVIVEIVPETAEVVWEWNIFDHVIQERDASLPNYGSLKDNPQLLNMDAIQFPDWEKCETFMINSFDYNADLDQILISIRKMSEIAVIDHSTTTEEAKGSSGGRYGKGGDILYRWGNPQNYGRGTENDRVLYFQHNPNWIKYGEHKDKIVVFNNGFGRDGDYSSVEIINPPIGADGTYIINLLGAEAFEPSEPEVIYDKFNSDFNDYSRYTSGAVVLPNGNLFVTVGVNYRLIELNPSGDIVWEYVYNYDVFPNGNQRYLYRAEKYSIYDEAFENLNLLPDGTLEFPASPYNCEIFTSSTRPEIESDEIKVSQHPSYIELEHLNDLQFEFECYNVNGQFILKSPFSSQDHVINTTGFATGIYYLKLKGTSNQNLEVLKIFVK